MRTVPAAGALRLRRKSLWTSTLTAEETILPKGSTAFTAMSWVPGASRPSEPEAKPLKGAALASTLQETLVYCPDETAMETKRLASGDMRALLAGLVMERTRG
jgi:hypothetical protein